MISTTVETPPLEPEVFRADFPILGRWVREGVPLVYFDNAASTQRPQQVIQSIVDCYEEHYANVHRGIHQLAQESDELFDEARETVRRFINAPAVEQIIFTYGHDRGHQPRGAELGRREHPPRRRNPAHRNGASREPRPLAATGRPPRRRAAAHPPDRRRPAATGPARRAVDASGPGWWPSRPSPTCWARSTRWRRSSAAPTRPAPWCWSTAPRACRTRRPTCRPWTPISWSSAGTRCWGPRAWACSTASGSCWRRCRRSWAAAA